VRHGVIHTGRLLLRSLCLLLLLSLAACDRGPVGPATKEDPIYNADGGFIITQGMLDMQYNQITFPATHNSFAGPDWDDNCGNQHLTVFEQLHHGIRFIELDVDREGCASHGGWCTQPLIPLLEQIREYAREHPRQIITIRISDLASDRRKTDCTVIRNPDDWVDKGCNIPRPLIDPCAPPPEPIDSYEMVNWCMEFTGLDAYIYNWDASISYNRKLEKCYVPERWPTLREMINSGKNIMFIHHKSLHDILDSGYFRGLEFNDYNDTKHHDMYKSFQLADLSKMQSVWEPAHCERQKEGNDRLFLLECNANMWKACGTFLNLVWEMCPLSYRSCNDGRRLYQLAKQHEEDPFLLPGDRVVNFIAVDYYMSTEEYHGGFRLPINVVDACNRLNYERVKRFDWKNCSFAWELEPHEFDKSKTEYTQQIGALREEVVKAIHDYKTSSDGLFGLEFLGGIISTAAHRQMSHSEHSEGKPTDWRWLPEWAVDDDYYTAWRGMNWGGSLVIDLRARCAIDEIAIAWKYSHRAPGFNVYASNDGEVMNNLPTNTAGWTLVATRPARLKHTPQMWDKVAFPLCSSKYVKIELTEEGAYWGSAIFELRVYGPKN
jgi:hypothetical protein